MMKFLAFCVSFFWVGSALAAPSVSAAKTYLLRGDYVAAARASEELLAGAGGTSARGADEAHYLAGLSYLKHGNYARARDHFESVVSDFSSSPFEKAAAIGIADSRYLEGDFKSADKAYASLAGKSAYREFKPALYGRLRMVALKMGKTAQAELYAQKLRKQYSMSPEARKTNGAGSLAAFAAKYGSQESSRATVTNGANDLAGMYSVQVGAFGSRSNAERLKSKLAEQGYVVKIAESGPGEKKSYKVRVGSESSRPSADVLKRELSLQGYPTTICQ